MSNEEKARELSHDYFRRGQLGFVSPDSESAGYECAIKMAERKDAQIKEELNLIIEWFNHIKQIANDKKTLNGFVMKDSDALDEIKCIAKDSIEYINTLKEEMKYDKP